MTTGDPKGVVVTHGALSHNILATRRPVEGDRFDMVTWLPAYHDMGARTFVVGLHAQIGRHAA